MAVATIITVTDRLYDAFALIASQPGIGRKRPEWTSAEVRFWSMTTDPYLIIYRERRPWASHPITVPAVAA